MEVSGKNSSGIYQKSSTMAAHSVVVVWFTTMRRPFSGQVVERHKQLCTSLGSLKDA